MRSGRRPGARGAVDALRVRCALAALDVEGQLRHGRRMGVGVQADLMAEVTQLGPASLVHLQVAGQLLRVDVVLAHHRLHAQVVA